MFDPDQSPRYVNVHVENEDFKSSLFEADFFDKFGFVSLDSKVTLNSAGNPSIVLIGEPEYVGNWTITQEYQEIGTPQLYGINVTFSIEI